jgi:putative flippase GtrA
MQETILKALPAGFPAFLAAGAIGFLVDASILATLVHSFGWGDYTARIVSFSGAVTVTWYLNRRFAFAGTRTANRRREYTRYLGVQFAGMLVNFIVYSVCIAASPTMDRWPVLALAVGSAVALLFNFAGSRIFVFTGSNRDTKT